MTSRHQYLPLIIIAAAVFLAAVPASAQKSAGEKAIEEFQNRQRVLSLVQYENRIKALDDAPMRCAARQRIASFIYETELKDLAGYADDQVEACLRETSVNSAEFVPSNGQVIRSSLITLLRKHSPEKAKLLEEKYPVKGIFSDLADNKEIMEAEDVGPAVERVIARIKSGEITPMTNASLRNLRKKNPELANRALDALVTYYETRSAVTESDKLMASYGLLFADPTVPGPIRDRYLKMSMNLARRSLNEPGNEFLYQASVPNLRLSLPQIEKYMPEALGEAKSILAALELSRAKADGEKENALERIAESEDKLDQILREIEEAKDQELKVLLIRQGASIALAEKKFKLSVDLANLVKEPQGGFSWKVFHIRNMVPGAALRAGDVDAVEYVIETLEDSVDKADVTLSLVSHFKRNDKSELAVSYLDRVLKLLDDAETSASSMNVLRQAAVLIRGMDGYDLFDFAGRAVRLINSLPTEDPEEARDPKRHAEFVTTNFYGAGNSAAAVFESVCEKNPEAAYPYIQSIQRRDIRLMAEISYEKLRTHPLPK